MSALLYGEEYFKLHERLLKGLDQTLPSGIQINLWLNTVGPATLSLVDSLSRSGRTGQVFVSEINMPKYKAMRQLFDVALRDPRYNWALWFDDDTRIEAADWYSKTTRFIAEKAGENICYFGFPCGAHHMPGQWEFITASIWFKGCAPLIKRGGPAVLFAQGSYWWLRMDVLRMLNWPDSRLNHCGGDTLLGEAVRQQGLPFHQFCYGVIHNDAPRRGMQETPAGAKILSYR